MITAVTETKNSASFGAVTETKFRSVSSSVRGYYRTEQTVPWIGFTKCKTVLCDFCLHSLTRTEVLYSCFGVWHAGVMVDCRPLCFRAATLYGGFSYRCQTLTLGYNLALCCLVGGRNAITAYRRVYDEVTCRLTA